MAAEPALRQVGIRIISSGSIEGQLIKGANETTDGFNRIRERRRFDPGSIRRGLAATHGHELFLTESENQPSGLVETVCELSVVRIHHPSSFRL